MSKKPKKHDTGPPVGPIDFREQNALREALPPLLQRANRPMQMDAILRVGSLPRKAKKHVESALFSLRDEGRVVRSSAGWSAPKTLRHCEGTLSINGAGVGFVTPASGGPDVYIHPSYLGDGWPGDTVEVLILPGRRGPSREGRITRVLRRARSELAATALREQRDGAWLCAPAAKRIPALFMLRGKDQHAAIHEYDILLIRPTDKLGPNLWQAELLANLEQERSVAAQERITRANHSVPGPFPARVLDEANALPEDPSETDFSDRVDLRHMPFVTIDGRHARDFDDAIHVMEDATGFRLHVAIADVSHYVPQGGALDNEARLRGNSWYFPTSVTPMLPERLSNGLCSLRPDVPRLVMVADIRFTADGRVREATFYPAVIQSQARLTYGQIQGGLLLRQSEAEAELAGVLPMLEQAKSLAGALHTLRQHRGSLDFALPEPAYTFDGQGNVTAIHPRERHFGHRMIEEFMIAANEAVARYCEARKTPLLFRVHERPDAEKLEALLSFVVKSGLEVSIGGLVQKKSSGKRKAVQVSPSSRELQRILQSVKDTPQDYILTRLMLRSMMQARYQTDNEGHYGLASSSYCHFTSPIRRYADLTVHRALKQTLNLPESMQEKQMSAARLEKIAEHINETERAAVDAEREIAKRLAALFLEPHVGEVFTGVVSGVTDFGLFIELDNVFAEGLIRMSNLNNDYYDYSPERQEVRGRRTNTAYRLGQKVRVTLQEVILSRQEIRLAPMQDKHDDT